MMMTKVHAGPRRMRLAMLTVLVCWCTASLSAATDGATGEAEQGDGLSNPSLVRAAGDGAGVFLLVREQVKESEGFRIFRRALASDHFFPGPAYTGEPGAVAIHRQRLLVYLTGGGAHSYDLQGPVRTEARVGRGLRVLACGSQGDTMYVLVGATESAELLMPIGSVGSALSDGVSAGSSGDANAPAGTGEESSAESATVGHRIEIESGQWLVMGYGGGGPWYSLTEQPLGDLRLEHPCLGVLDGVIHLFGVSTDEAGRLHGYEIKNGQVSPGQGLDIDDVVRPYCLNVNQQLRLVLALRAPSMGGQGEQDGVTSCVYRVGWLREDGWRFSGLLEAQADEILEGPVEQVTFACFGQNLAAFHGAGPRETYFGLYSPEGVLIEPLTHPVQPSGDRASTFLMWFFSPYAGTALLIATFGIFLWRRNEAYTPAALPAHLQVAPLPKRLMAFVLDTIPASLLAGALFPDVMEHLPSDRTLWEQTRIGYVDPSIYRFMAVGLGLLLLYFTLCELILSTTPGKMITRLQVVDYQGKPLKAYQALIRNVLRFELHPAAFFVLFVVFFTLKRQRLGDLAARTLVVFKNPQAQGPEGILSGDVEADKGRADRDRDFDEG